MSAELRFTKDNVFSGISVRSFGSSAYDFEAGKYMFAALSELQMVQQTMNFAVIKELVAKKLPDFFMFDIEVINFERPVTSNEQARLNDNVSTLLFLRLKPEFSFQNYKQIYDVRQFEPLSDALMDIILTPQPAYPTSDTDLYRPVTQTLSLQYPSNDTLGDRSPATLANKIDNMRMKHTLQLQETRYAYEQKSTTIPTWANPDEITDCFRTIGMIMLPIELLRIETATSQINLLYQNYKAFYDYILSLSTNNFNIDLQTTISPIIEKEPVINQRKLPILELPKTLVTIDYLFTEMPDYVNAAAVAKTGRVPVIFSKNVSAVQAGSSLAWAGGQRSTENNSLNLPQMNRNNLDDLSNIIRWSIFNPCYNKIQLTGIFDGTLTGSLCLCILMMLLPSAMFSYDQLITQNNTIYSVFYKLRILNRTNLPDPDALGNRTTDMLVFLASRLQGQPRQVVNFFSALAENRAPAIVYTEMYYSDGLRRDKTPLGPQKFTGSKPYASCFELSDVRLQSKATAIGAMLDTVPSFRTIPGVELLDPNTNDAFVKIMRSSTYRIVRSVYDCCQSISLNSILSIYSGLGDRQEVSAYNFRSINVRSVIGCVLGNDGDEYPLMTATFDDASAFDSLVFIARLCKSMMQTSLIRKWNLVIDSLSKIYGTVIALNDTFFHKLYDAQFRSRFYTAIISYNLPRMYNELLLRIETGKSLYRELKPIMGFESVCYITLLESQALARYSGIDMTNSLSQSQIQILYTLDEVDLLHDSITPYINPLNTNTIITNRTMLSQKLHELRMSRVPSMAAQSVGEKIPVIVLKIKHIVNSHIYTVKNLSMIKKSTVFSPSSFIENVCRKGQYFEIEEHCYILDNTRFQDPNDIDDAVIGTELLLVPQITPNRVKNIPLDFLTSNVQKINTKKQIYTVTTDVNIKISAPAYGRY